MSILFLSFALLHLDTEPTKAVGEPAVKGEDYSPCGLTSLYLVCQLKGARASWQETKDILGPAKEDGTHSFADLAAAAKTLGLYPLGIHAGREELSHCPMPAIVQTSFIYKSREPHICVVLACTAAGVHILDAPHPPVFVPWVEFETAWTGNVLLFAEDAAQLAALEKNYRQVPSSALVIGMCSIMAVTMFLVGLGYHVRSRRRFMVGSVENSDAYSATGTRWGRKSLHRIAWLIVAVGICGFIALAGQKLRALPATLAFEKPQIELGDLKPGEHTIKAALTNGGDKPLVIAKASTTCSCASITMLPRQILPRSTESMEIKLRVSPGAQMVRVIVESDDAVRTKVLPVTWTGTTTPGLIPANIGAENIRSDMPFIRDIKLPYPIVDDKSVAHLSGFKCDDPSLTIRQKDINRNAYRVGCGPEGKFGEVTFQVEVKPRAMYCTFRHTAKLFVVSNGVKHDLELPISVSFVGPIVADSDRIVFSATKLEAIKGQTSKILIKLRNVKSELIIVHSPAWMRCKTERTSAGEVVLTVTASASPPSLLTEDTVDLALDGRKEPMFSIHVNSFASRK